MSYDPRQLLKFCKSLSKKSRNLDLETITRVIVSRAYYSAFLHSREYLKEKHSVLFAGTGDDHITVERKLRGAPIRLRRLLSSMIRELRENRCAADYDLDNPATAISRYSPVSIKYRQLKFDRNTQVNSIKKAEYITNNLHR